MCCKNQGMSVSHVSPVTTRGTQISEDFFLHFVYRHFLELCVGPSTKLKLVCECSVYVCLQGSEGFSAAGEAEAALECNQKNVQQITLTCCRPLFSRSQYLVIPPNCSGSSQIPLSTDPSNYSVCLRTARRPHLTSPRSNYVFTGTRSRRWGIWIIL